MAASRTEGPTTSASKKRPRARSAGTGSASSGARAPSAAKPAKASKGKATVKGKSRAPDGRWRATEKRAEICWAWNHSADGRGHKGASPQPRQDADKRRKLEELRGRLARAGRVVRALRTRASSGSAATSGASASASIASASDNTTQVGIPWDILRGEVLSGANSLDIMAGGSRDKLHKQIDDSLVVHFGIECRTFSRARCSGPASTLCGEAGGLVGPQQRRARSGSFCQQHDPGRRRALPQEGWAQRATSSSRIQHAACSLQDLPRDILRLREVFFHNCSYGGQRRESPSFGAICRASRACAKSAGARISATSRVRHMHRGASTRSTAGRASAPMTRHATRGTSAWRLHSWCRRRRPRDATFRWPFPSFSPVRKPRRRSPRRTCWSGQARTLRRRPLPVRRTAGARASRGLRTTCSVARSVTPSAPQARRRSLLRGLGGLRQ